MIVTNISGHHMDLTQPLKEHIKHKVELLNNHFEKLNVNFILKRDGKVNVAEANTRLLGKSMSITTTGSDMYSAITELIQKLDRALRRFKGKNIR